MVSEDMDLVPPQQRMENGLNSQMVFQDDSLQYCSGGGASQHPGGDPGRKPRVAMTGFMNDKLFTLDQRERYFRMQGAELRRSIYDSPGHPPRERPDNQDWNAHGSTETPSGDGTEGDEDDDEDDEEDDDDDDEGDGEVDGLVVADDGNKNNNSSGSVQSSSEKIRNEKAHLSKSQSSFGPSRRVLVKDNGGIHSLNNFRGSLSEQHQQGRMNHYDNAIAIAEPDLYYQMLQGQDGASLAQKEIGGENGCGTVRKDTTFPIESGDSLRMILSDPITGTLMDDAMILTCGHSFGSVGLQHVLRMKSCCTCSKSVSEDSVSPNLALRSAVQAFRREEELQSSKASKRRRERLEQDKCSYGDPFPMDISRGKGVQFPFAVTDRVIIRKFGTTIVDTFSQGNKRTPQRFVGREAVVTTQCLNGWYVVKTLDNAESVKLQYRSLAKVPDNPSSNLNSSKPITPNWL